MYDYLSKHGKKFLPNSTSICNNNTKQFSANQKKRDFPQPDKELLQKPQQPSLYLTGKDWKLYPSSQEQGMNACCHTPIQHCIGVPSLCNESRKGNRRNTDGKGRNTTVFIHGWHDHMCRKSQRIYKKARISGFSNIIRIKQYKNRFCLCIQAMSHWKLKFWNTL